jgi:hypothetical protein
MSHVAARQEIRDLIAGLDLPSLAVARAETAAPPLSPVEASAAAPALVSD